MPRIAIDAMGGDRAPEEIVLGALGALRAGTQVILVGDQERINPLLEEHAADLDVPVVHASEIIHMGDDPAGALREKKDSSIAVAARLVASGEAEGLVSAGSTGAAMAAAALLIGRLPHVSRPAIATLLPTRKVLLDAGANLAVRPIQIGQFAVMGAALAASHYSLDAPRVGLLNIGEESGKGRDLEKESFALLSEMPGINFIGNIEGHDIVTPKADVIVTDGYTGNVFLKTAEGTAAFIQQIVFKALAEDEDPAVLAPAVTRIESALDFERVGGAHLLGVGGVVVIAHGSSSRRAFQGAIELAAEGAVHEIPSHIERGLVAADRGG